VTKAQAKDLFSVGAVVEDHEDRLKSLEECVRMAGMGPSLRVQAEPTWLYGQEGDPHPSLEPNPFGEW